MEEKQYVITPHPRADPPVKLPPEVPEKPIAAEFSLDEFVAQKIEGLRSDLQNEIRADIQKEIKREVTLNVKT